MRIALLAASLCILAVSVVAAEPKARLPAFGCTDMRSAYRPESPQNFHTGSTSAMGITGDITVDRDRVIFRGTGPGRPPPYVKAEMKLHYLGAWQPTREQLEGPRGGCVALYEIRPPFSTRLRAVGLCGGFANDTPAVYLAAFQDSASEIRLYVFGPDADFESSEKDATDFCGGFGYYLEDKK